MKNLITLLFITVVQLSTAQQWYNIEAPTTNKLTEVDFPSPLVGFIGGENKTLLKTTDGGITWNTLDISTLSEISFSITDLSFLTDNIGYMIAGTSWLYKTEDGGNTWTRVEHQGANQLCFLSKIHPVGPDHYFLGGSGCFQSEFIYEFVNGTYILRPDNLEMFGAEHAISDFAFHDNMGIATTVGTYFLRSTNNGASWDSIPTNLEYGYEYLTGVVFLSSDTLYASYTQQGGSMSGNLKSTDGGLSWSIDSDMAFFLSPSIHSIEKSHNNTLFAAGGFVEDFNAVFYKPSGSWWEYTLLEQPVYDVASYGDDVAFVVGDSGFIAVNRDPSTIGVLDNSTAIFNLFPNPVETELRLTSREVPNMEMEIINGVGQVVKQANYSGSQGTVNLENLPSGTYWIRVSWDGETRKKAFVKR